MSLLKSKLMRIHLKRKLKRKNLLNKFQMFNKLRKNLLKRKLKRKNLLKRFQMLNSQYFNQYMINQKIGLILRRWKKLSIKSIIDKLKWINFKRKSVFKAFRILINRNLYIQAKLSIKNVINSLKRKLLCVNLRN